MDELRQIIQDKREKMERTQRPADGQSSPTKRLQKHAPPVLFDSEARQAAIDAAMSGPCQCGGSGYFEVPDLFPVVTVECSCSARCNRERKIKRLFADAGIPSRFTELTFESFDALPNDWKRGKESICQCARWFADVDNYREYEGVRMTYRRANGEFSADVRPGVLFFGPVGTCKTGLASVVARSWLDVGESVMWITYVHLIKAVQAGYSEGGNVSEERVVMAQNADLVVLDDLGSRRVDRQESYDRNEILYRILERRHVEGRATLITTNLTPEQIEQQFDDRIASRLYEMCHWVAIPGDSADLRKARAFGGAVEDGAK